MNNYDYKKKARARNKDKAMQLLGNVCKNCGSIDKLEFDHIDPKTVTFRIGSYQLSYSWAKIEEEVKKCQLLCKDCHWEKTRQDRQLDGKDHGTVNMYTNYRCRCDECRKAWTTYYSLKRKQYRQKAWAM